MINIILDHTNVNYTHKITLICVFLLILSFLFKFFPIIFMKFPPYQYFCQNIYWYFIDIYDVYVKSKYLYIHVYWYFHPCLQLTLIWTLILVFWLSCTMSWYACPMWYLTFSWFLGISFMLYIHHVIFWGFVHEILLQIMIVYKLTLFNLIEAFYK